MLKKDKVFKDFGSNIMTNWLKKVTGKMFGRVREGDQTLPKHAPKRLSYARTAMGSFSGGFHFEPLEPRLLLSAGAEGGAAGAAIQDTQQGTQQAVEAENFMFAEQDQTFSADLLAAVEIQEDAAASEQETSSKKTGDSPPDKLANEDSSPLVATPSDTFNEDGNENVSADILPEKSEELLSASAEDQAEAREEFIVERSELVIVDGGITDYQPLVDDLLDNRDGGFQYEIVVLDPETDGISQISELLAEYQDLDAVHIVSHGTDRAVKLGSVWVYGENFDVYGEDIAGWKSSLAGDADLLFYGCDLAGGEDGRTLLQSFADLTGADVAASVDDTGHTSLGGDWDLEYNTGQIQHGVALSFDAQQEWANLLATGYYLDQFNTVSFSGDDGTLSWTNDWQEVGGDIGGVTGGDILVTDPFGDLDYALQIQQSGEGASRQADLSGAASATLSFEYVRMDMDATEDYVQLEISTDGTNWDLLQEFGGGTDATWQSFNTDISAYIDTDTQIRFTAVSMTDVNDHFYVDDVRIDLSDAAPSNNAPTASGVPTDVSVTEDTASSFDLSAVTFSDIDGDSLTVTLAASGGTFNASGSGGVTIGGSGAGTLTLSGTAADINTYLDTVTNIQYTGASNASGDDAATFTLNAEDGTVNPQVGSGNIDIAAVNDAPVVSGTFTGSVAEGDVGDLPVTATGTLSISDVDADDSPVFNDQAATAGDNAYGSFVLSAGTWTYTLDQSAVQDLDAGDNVADTITYTATDGTAQQITVTITGTGDAPAATSLDSAETYTEDTPLNLTDIVVTDVDSANITVSLTLSDPAAGFLNTSTSGAVTSTFAGGVWTASGAIADVNTLLAGVVFTPAANYNSNFTIDTSVDDGVVPALKGTKAVTGIPVNDAPVLDNSGAPTLTEINENETSISANPGDEVADIIAPITDADTGALEGIAVVSVDDSHGTWQYSTDGGWTWTAFGAVSESSAVVLGDSGNDRIRFLPDTNYNGTALIAYRAWDQTDGNTSGTTGVDASTVGSTTPFSTAAETASITIIPVEIVLHMTTAGDVSFSGVPGLDEWSTGEVLAFGDPDLSFGLDSTDGTFSSQFNLENYTGGVSITIDSLHIVSSNITVGGANGTVNLQKNDILFSVVENATFTGKDSTDVMASKTDVIRFRPSDETFEMVLYDLALSPSIGGMTLVEKETEVGSDDKTTLAAGSFLLSKFNDNNIFYLNPTGAGQDVNPGVPELFINGDDALINLGGANIDIDGIDLIEDDINAKGTALKSGQILVTLDENYKVGSNGLSVEAHDIFYLNVKTTEMVSGASEATATLFVDGSNIHLDTDAERVSGLSFDAEFGIQSVDPEIALPGGAVDYTENEPPMIIDAAATLTDPDSPDFENGQLRVDFAVGGSSEDRLAIADAGQVTVSGSTVNYGGTDIGTFTGGGAGTPLVITFNSSANDVVVQAVMRNIAYENISDDPSSVPRTVRFAMTDGDGGASNVVAVAVNVVAVNDAPVITGATLSVDEGQTVTLAAANFAITDPDDTSFTYTVSGIAGGYFQLSSAPTVPITTFTSADLSAATVQFVDNGDESAPA
ncbi:MAG: DUF4347 domain-containing protein, partial [Desulfobacterales bacterium]|nr:DUF4347 domain-containing protein [Desulfobacterales bacterium]